MIIVAMAVALAVIVSRMFSFPRNLITDYFIRDGPTGCTGFRKNQCVKQKRYVSL